MFRTKKCFSIIITVIVGFCPMLVSASSTDSMLEITTARTWQDNHYCYASVYWETKDNVINNIRRTGGANGTVIMVAYASRDQRGYRRMEVGHAGCDIQRGECVVSMPKSKFPGWSNHLWVKLTARMGQTSFSPLWKYIYGSPNGIP